MSWFQRIHFFKKLGLCEKLYGSRLARRGICDIETGSGLVWKLDLRNPTHRWIMYGLYDPPFILWARRFLRRDSVVVDVGANIGQIAMYLGQCVPKGHFYAFEPGRAQGAWLENCVQKNRSALPSTEVHFLALGSSKQQVFLEDTWKSERFHGGSSTISKDHGESVSMVRLADFLREKNIPRVDLWKLDVEGYEIQALEGAREYLENRQIKALYVELYRQDGKPYHEHGVEIRRYLAQFGYECHIFKQGSSRPQPENGITNARDGLFMLRDPK